MEANNISEFRNIHEGDKQAFELLFRCYYQQLCYYSNQIIHHKDDAEEIVQEMFVHLWQKRETLEIHTSLKAYLFRSVHNSCLNYLKHNTVKEAYAQHLKNENTEDEQITMNTSETKDLQQAIKKAIEGLPPERKKIFLMIRFEERKYKEVAEILGISVKTVENQMGKAMQFLRKALSDFLPMIILLLLSGLLFFLNVNR